MRVVASVVLLVALLAGAALGSSVVDATDATFDTVVASAELVLMEFYAPWCGHCKKLEPEYSQAAQQIGSTAVLAKLDATVESKSAAKYEVKGYPTIKVFRNGALAGDYNGGRTAADLVKWVAANTGPAVTPVATSAELEALKKQHSVLAVLFSTSVGNDNFEAFETVAKSLRESFTFAVVSDSALFDGEDNTLVVYKHFDDKKEVFTGAFDAAGITAFVSNAGVPLFDEIGPHNYKMYMDRKLPIAWLFATAADSAALDAGRATAPSFKGKVSFVWIDSSKYAGMAQRVGLKGEKFPAFVINDDTQKRFVYPEGEAITGAELLSFVTKYTEGSLTPSLRSDPAPQPHTVDGLTTVVGSTFNELVAEADTDVLIEFYAPWCGHCKQLAPVYEAVAKTLQDAPVRIAKIDATTNDFDQTKFSVQGFPTLFFVPKSTHVPVPYVGARSEEALLKFLEFVKS